MRGSKEKMIERRVAGIALFALAAWLAPLGAADFDVKTFRRQGRRQNAATATAINKAIEAAAAAGGGTVRFPPGTYLTGSIRLRSNLTLQFEPGATLEAAADPAAYDAPEPNQWNKFQDSGHSHFHNSLIWGEGLENVTIAGRRPDLRPGRWCRRARAAWATRPSRSSFRAQRDAARFLDSQRRTLRHPGHRRG